MQLTPPADAAPDDAAELLADDKVDILIVDDLPEKLLVFGSVLEELQQNLVFVRSGAEALREVLKREFAVILLDVNMPDIDGFETAALIRQYKRSAHTPIIFVTAFADEMQTAKGYSLGAVDYILSPVVPEVLRSKVRVFVDLHRMSRRVRRQADERVALAQALAAKSAAEDNERRSKFLVEASRQLGQSLDVEVGQRKLLELVVPSFATLALVVRADGEAFGDAMFATPQTPHARIEWEALPAPVRAAIAGAVDRARAEPLDAAQLAAIEPARFGLAAASRFGAAIALPLPVGARVTGALFVAADASTRELQTRDWSALDSLVVRAAIASENARLHASLQAEIAEHSAARAELERADRRKDEFLAMLSHELRNPLAPICTAVEVMRRVAPPDAKLTWATDVIDRQARHLGGLVDDLLDVARISQGKITLNRERIDLNAVVAQAVETAQPMFDTRHQRLVVEKGLQPVWLNGDGARLSQVVSNLLNNAAKYSDEGARTELRVSAGEGSARIAVRDHGIGMDPALMPQIFELFAQGDRSLDRAQGGLGVGLTLVRRLVEMHGGRVAASSAGRGQGSEFVVTLPCLSVIGDGPGGGDALPASAAPSGGARVLIVDDNLDAAESIALFLQLEGHEVKCARESLAALGCAPAFAPQVVLLDIGLPVLDGYEVARRLRALPATRDALIVAVSGYGQPEDRQRAKDAGFDHHFVKPTDPQALVELIARWQREPRALRPAANGA